MWLEQFTNKFLIGWKFIRCHVNVALALLGFLKLKINTGLNGSHNAHCFPCSVRLLHSWKSSAITRILTIKTSHLCHDCCSVVFWLISELFVVIIIMETNLCCTSKLKLNFWQVDSKKLYAFFFFSLLHKSSQFFAHLHRIIILIQKG